MDRNAQSIHQAHPTLDSALGHPADDQRGVGNREVQSTWVDPWGHVNQVEINGGAQPAAFKTNANQVLGLADAIAA